MTGTALANDRVWSDAGFAVSSRSVASDDTISMEVPPSLPRFFEATLAAWREAGVRHERARTIDRIPGAADPPVGGFLAQRPYLIDLIGEAEAHIRRHFGPEAGLKLVLAPDLDAEDELWELHLFIGTKLPPRTAYEQIKRFDKTWWIGDVPRARGDLVIDVDYATWSTGTNT